jgi:hypothetical protein
MQLSHGPELDPTNNTASAQVRISHFIFLPFSER